MCGDTRFLTVSFSLSLFLSFFLCLSPILLLSLCSLSSTGSSQSAPKKLKSLRDDFFKWSKGRAGDSRHSFQDVIIDPKIGKKFSNQMQETLEEYGRSYNHSNSTQHEFVLSSLAYTPPLGRKPRNGLEEILEVQIKKLNKMWMQRCLQGWKESQKEVLRGLDTAMEDALAAAEDDSESKDATDQDIDADYDGDGASFYFFSIFFPFVFIFFSCCWVWMACML